MKINLVNKFIKHSKLLVNTLILFIKNTNRRFYLCINYQNFNQ